MEFLSVILFKKTTMRPAQAVDPKSFKVSFGNWFLSFNIWAEERSQKVEELSDSNNFWKWHNIVVVSVEKKLKIGFDDVLLSELFAPLGFLWSRLSLLLNSITAPGLDEWSPEEISW